jgi:hypothetical protein
MSFRSYDLLKLVDEHGETLTLRKYSYGAYNPQTSALASSSSTDYTFTGYFYNYSLGVIDPENINRGIRKCVSLLCSLVALPSAIFVM